MGKRVLVLPGDYIGPEIMAEAVKVIECLQADFGFAAELEPAAVGYHRRTRRSHHVNASRVSPHRRPPARAT